MLLKKKLIWSINRVSPIIDVELEDYLKNKHINLKATSDKEEAYKDASLL